VRRRRIARRQFTSMTLLNKEEGRADWVLGRAVQVASVKIRVESAYGFHV
jgi:hypothetical protein